VCDSIASSDTLINHIFRIGKREIKAEIRNKRNKRGHSSFLLLFVGFLTGFHGNMALCYEPHELPSEGFATTF